MFGAVRRAQDEDNLRIAWDRHVEAAKGDPYGQSSEYRETGEALDAAQARVPWEVMG
jgi:hypothetical protein